MPKLIWEKKLQEAVKRQQRFGWSVRDKRGKVLVQRYYPDINKKVSATIPILWEPNQELNVLNALQKINEVMQNSGCSLKEAVEILYFKSIFEIIYIFFKSFLDNLLSSFIIHFHIFRRFRFWI